MILVIGGIASGKRTYVHALGFDDAQITTDLHSKASVLYGLEGLLSNGALSNEELALLQNKAVVVCREVGLGVVPVDARERAWRELVGRTCCELASRASRVVRLVCGIPVTLAGTAPQEERA